MGWGWRVGGRVVYYLVVPSPWWWWWWGGGGEGVEYTYVSFMLLNVHGGEMAY